VKPQRIQLRRSKGWRLPEGAVKVDRTTIWGNPFIVGAQGSAILCVYNYALMLSGYLCVSVSSECRDRQAKALAWLKTQAPDYSDLKGRDLACWCKPGDPCHGDLLLFLANRVDGEQLDLEAFLARYGWYVENGEARRLS
jgi:hypothetical protein